MSIQRKLQLNVQDLHVESFDPAAPGATGRGTVHGHAPTDTATGGFAGCECQTWAYTCYGSCPNTCHNTCPGATGCPEAGETEAATCVQTCYYVGTRPFIDGIC
jgi:hypothetical protein